MKTWLKLPNAPRIWPNYNISPTFPLIRLRRQDSRATIFHPPIFLWNKGISLYSAYLLRWKLVWGRELIWPEKTGVLNFHPQFVAGLLSANYPNALKVHPQARNSTPISLRHRHLDDLCRRWLSHTTWNIFANKVIPLDGDEKTTLKPQPRSTHEFKTFPLPVLEYCLIHIINMQHWKTSKTRKVVHIYVTLRTCHNLFWRTSNPYHYTSLDTYDSQFWHGSYIHYTNSNTCKCNLEPCGRWLPWFPKYFPLFLALGGLLNRSKWHLTYSCFDPETSPKTKPKNSRTLFPTKSPTHDGSMGMTYIPT